MLPRQRLQKEAINTHNTASNINRVSIQRRARSREEQRRRSPRRESEAKKTSSSSSV